MANAHIAEGATGTRLRYSCAKNYKRQAGTSSLVVCKYNEMSKKPEWTRPNINCIRDPSLPPEPETATEDSGRDFLYFSIGFPALVGFIVICSLLWCLYRRKRGTVVGPHTKESIPMAPVTSREEGSSFSPLDDPEPSGEGAPMLRIHHAAPTSLAHHQASANGDGDGSS
nr:interleukin-15 receptor subunit alpha isoform X4 [Pogona vitticeps]